MRRIPTIVMFAYLFVLAGVAAHAGSESASIDSRAVASIHTMFGDSVAATRMSVVLTPQEQKAILEASQTRWTGDSITLYRCESGGRIMGYGFLDDVKGKMQSITMLVGVLPDGTIRDVDILIYRESYGGEVTNESFRRQFRGLSAASDLKPGSPIRNISGATISARAVTFGARKIAATYRVLQERLSK